MMTTRFRVAEIIRALAAAMNRKMLARLESVGTVPKVTTTLVFLPPLEDKLDSATLTKPAEATDEKVDIAILGDLLATALKIVWTITKWQLRPKKTASPIRFIQWPM